MGKRKLRISDEVGVALTGTVGEGNEAGKVLMTTGVSVAVAVLTANSGCKGAQLTPVTAIVIKINQVNINLIFIVGQGPGSRWDVKWVSE